MTLQSIDFLHTVYLFPRSFIPRALSSLEIICWLGIAFPDSYSWIIWGFSFINYKDNKIGWESIKKNTK